MWRERPVLKSLQILPTKCPTLSKFGGQAHSQSICTVIGTIHFDLKSCHWEFGWQSCFISKYIFFIKSNLHIYSRLYQPLLGEDKSHIDDNEAYCGVARRTLRYEVGELTIKQSQVFWGWVWMRTKVEGRHPFCIEQLDATDAIWKPNKPRVWLSSSDFAHRLFIWNLESSLSQTYE